MVEEEYWKGYLLLQDINGNPLANKIVYGVYYESNRTTSYTTDQNGKVINKMQLGYFTQFYFEGDEEYNGCTYP